MSCPITCWRCQYFYWRIMNKYDMSNEWHVICKCEKVNKILREFDMDKLGVLSPILTLQINDNMKEFMRGNFERIVE